MPTKSAAGGPRPVPPAAVAAEPEEETRAELSVSPREGVIETCEQELTLKPEKTRAARLHFEVARALEDPKEALKHYRTALELNPEHLPSIRAARKLTLSQRDVKAAVPLFDAEIELTNDAERCAMLHYAKGRALEDLAGDHAAARRCFAQAAALDESAPLILKALQHCELHASEWAGLEQAREQEAKSTADDPRHRAALLVERARLLETRLGDVESATEIYRMALELDDGAVGALQALKRLLHAQKRWQELLEVLQREAEYAVDPDVRVMALFRISRIHSERLGNHNEAIEALVRAMRIRSTDLLVLEELIKLYEPTDETTGLARTLEQLSETVTEPKDRLAVVQRIAELYDVKHGDDEKAAPWYLAALQIDPTFPPALHALDTLFSTQERWQELIEMRLAEANASPDPLRRAQAHARVAEVLEVELEQHDEAAREHGKALSLAPEFETSFKALCRLHAMAGRHRELIELYERAIDRARDEDVVIAYLFKIGSIYEDPLQSPGLALPAYRRILDRQSDHVGAVHAMQRAAESSHHFEDLVEALEREAALVKQPSLIVALLQRAGDVLADKLRDRDAAIGRFRKVLELDPNYVPALTSLGRLYHRLGRWKDVLDVHGRELEVTSNPEAKVALLVRMAELSRYKLGNDDRAVGYYRKAIELDPKHAPALHALARLLRERGDWAALVKVIETEISGLSEPQALARAAYRLGEVYEVHLRKPGLAIKAYERSIEAVPAYRPSLDALARVNTETKAWKQLARTLQAEVANAPEPRLAIDAWLRAGEVYSELLDEPAEAVRCHEAILEREPNNLAALLALETLYRRQKAWQQLAVVYTRQAKVLRDKYARVAALEALARLFEAHLPERSEDLRRTYGSVLSADPGNSVALEGLERIAIASGDRDLLADVDSRSTKAEESATMVAAHFTRLGECLEAGSTAAALAAYRSALEREPDNLAAIRGLARVADKRGDIAAAVEAARREADWTKNPEHAADLLVRSAMLRVQRLNDRDGAIKDAEQALLRCPDHAGGAYRLMELLLWTNQIERLIELLTAAANATKNQRRKAQLWQTVANLYADHQDDVSAGIAALKRALKCQPDDVGTLMRLADLYGRDTQWDRAAGMLERVVELRPGEKQRLEAHLGLARIFTKHRPDRECALVNLSAALELESEHRDALAMLMDQHASDGELDEARAAAQRLVDAAKGPKDRAWALLHLGRLELGVGHKRTAAEALLTAITLEGPGGEAAAEYRQKLGGEEPWDRYADALSDHLRRAEAGEIEDADLPATYLEIARTQQDKLGRVPEAFETLRTGLRRCGEHPALGLELAEALGRAGRHPESIAEFQRQVHIEPTRALAWRGLARTLQEYGRPSEACAAAAPLVVLGEASDVERNLAAQRKTRPGWVRPGSCAAANLQTISAAPVKDESLIAAVLGTMLEALGKLYPTQLDRHGLTRSDRVPERSEHPLRSLWDRLLQAFAIERCELYVFHPRYGNDVVFELSLPPAVLVPAFVAELGEAEQVFLLARALAAVARGLHPAAHLGVEDLHQLLIAGARTAAPTYGTGWFDERQLADLQKRLVKALSRRNRRALEETASHYVAGPEIDVASWVKTLPRTRARVGALVAGDLPACVEMIRGGDPTLATLDGAALVGSSELLADLLRFWMSERAVEFRRLIGVV